MRGFLSIVIPVYNEEGNVEKLYFEVEKIIKQLIKDKKLRNFEVVFVNDGSRDNTYGVLESLKRKKGEKRERLNDLELFGELHRYITAYLYIKGYRVVEIRVNHRPELVEKPNIKNLTEG